MTATVEDRVLDVLSKIVKKDKSAIKLEHDLVADVGLDSPKTLQLLADLEDTFHIEISDEDAARITKVQQIVDYVKAQQK